MKILIPLMLWALILSFTPIARGSNMTDELTLPVLIQFVGIPDEGATLTIGSTSPRVFVFTDTEPLAPNIWVHRESCLTVEDVSNRFLLAIEAQVGHTSSLVDRGQSHARSIMLVYAGTPAIEVSTDSDQIKISAI